MGGLEIAIILMIIFLFLIAGGMFVWVFIVKTKQTRSKCNSDLQCPSDQYCSAGKCVDYGKCSKSSDCVGKQVCSKGTCVRCATNKDCSSDPGLKVCYGGKCVQCATDKDCPTGVCSDSNICVPCLENSDCPKGSPYCIKDSNSELNRCVVCMKDSECPSSQKCVDNSCVTTKTLEQRKSLEYRQNLPPRMPPRAELGSSVKYLKPRERDPYRDYVIYEKSWYEKY